MERLPERALVLVAHPDDEALAFGALLQRLRAPIVVFATDGAPRDRYFWQRYGSREAYAYVREQEAAAALALAGVDEFDFLGRVADQELFHHLDRVCHEVATIIRRRQPSAIFTLAYEGGHPDHDCCNFLTALLAREYRLPAWEAPLYHRRDGRFTTQAFLQETSGERDVNPTAGEIAMKRRMFDAYASQAETLAQFSPDRETVRPLVRYDYSRLPHEGELNYEAWQWPIRGWEVCDQFMQMLNQRETLSRSVR